MTEKEVERAIFITISAGIACWLTTYITIGTIMAPPPIPNNPAKIQLYIPQSETVKSFPLLNTHKFKYASFDESMIMADPIRNNISFLYI